MPVQNVRTSMKLGVQCLVSSEFRPPVRRFCIFHPAKKPTKSVTEFRTNAPELAGKPTPRPRSAACPAEVAPPPAARRTHISWCNQTRAHKENMPTLPLESGWGKIPHNTVHTQRHDNVASIFQQGRHPTSLPLAAKSDCAHRNPTTILAILKDIQASIPV